MTDLTEKNGRVEPGQSPCACGAPSTQIVDGLPVCDSCKLAAGDKSNVKKATQSVGVPQRLLQD